MDMSMTFTACGDSFITRRLPSKGQEFTEVSNLIKKAEARFTNLEVTVHNQEGYPSAFSGGTWAVAHPLVLEDIREYGFNLIGWANNHTMDYLYGGLEATGRYLDQYGFTHAGVGHNLARASAPRYLECPSGRVALIAATSSFHESWIAGEQRGDCIGRPGVNPLRYEERYIISSEHMSQLRSIAEVIGINNAEDLKIKEGFMSGHHEGVIPFGKHLFSEGIKVGRETLPDERDLKRILGSISEAERQADYVIVSIHSHEMAGMSKEEPDKFLIEFSRRCIDAGAHAVIGHGPHVLRGIEIYRKRPIFYSLGNFIFQSETIGVLPSDFYEKYKLGNVNNVADAFDRRSENGTKGLGCNPAVWESVIPYWRMENGELKELELYPIQLGYHLLRYKRGWPILSKESNVLHRLAELSKPFSTDMEIVDSVGKINVG